MRFLVGQGDSGELFILKGSEVRVCYVFNGSLRRIFWSIGFCSVRGKRKEHIIRVKGQLRRFRIGIK